MTRKASTEGGFTIVEILVAIMILTVGIFALAGTSAAITRQVGAAKWATISAEVAQQRMDFIRMAADATDPPCTHANFVSGGPVTTQGVTTSWNVPVNGISRTVQVITTYGRTSGLKTDTLTTRILCY